MKKFDILIQAGQSNAEGMGRGEVDNEFAPSSHIYTLTAEKTVEHFPEKLLITYADKPFSIQQAEERTDNGDKIADFALPFAALYEKHCLQADRDILIIRAAVGGSGFQKGQWTKDGILYIKLLEMIDYALSLNPENRLVAFLWHQGEHDAFEKNTPDRFEMQLKDMIVSVRNRYNVQDLPFITGDFVSEWKNKNLSDCTPIVDKIKKVATKIGNGAFVETADLLSNNQKTGNGDDIHFCRASQYELGKRYFNAYSALQK